MNSSMLTNIWGLVDLLALHVLHCACLGLQQRSQTIGDYQLATDESVLQIDPNPWFPAKNQPHYEIQCRGALQIPARGKRKSSTASNLMYSDGFHSFESPRVACSPADTSSSLFLSSFRIG